MLKTAALSMGGPQTQNVATIGGNVCNGATSADSAPSLFALDAVLELVSADGSRKVPVTEFYAGPGKVNKAHGELLTHIILPAGPRANRGGAYIKMSTRNAMDISTLGSAAVCVLDADGSIRSAAIALGTAGPVPMRCTEAEEVLTGKFLTDALLAEAGKKAAAAANPRSSWRASAAYRKYLAEELSARAFKDAFEAAGGTMR
jgi:xanthine dehydrogenase FAD-binding subunit